MARQARIYIRHSNIKSTRVLEYLNINPIDATIFGQMKFLEIPGKECAMQDPRHYAEQKDWENACRAVCADMGRRPYKVHFVTSRGGTSGRTTVYTAHVGDIERSHTSRKHARAAAFAGLYEQLQGGDTE